MKIDSIKYQSPYFKGYRNIITRQISNGPNKATFTFMTMQLNNAGTRDLDNWLNIQRQKLKVAMPTDILTIANLHLPESKELLWIGDKVLEEKIYRNSPFLEEHTVPIKEFLLAYNITGRLMNDNSWLVRDNYLMNVIQLAKHNLKNILDKHPIFGPVADNNKTAVEFIATSFIKEDKPQANAGEINHNIRKLVIPVI